MKKDWTYKKLIDVCGIQYGYPFDSKCFTEDNTYPALIRIRDVVRGYTETFYKGDVPEEYYVQKGEYLIGMDGEFNIAPWRSEKALLNQRVCKIFSITSNVDIQFVYYSLQRQLKQIEDETPFVTVKHLSAKRLNQIELPIPPLSIQRSIVAELDLLHSVISKKKEQLRELDNLAQSLFYQMFGDPITNPMDWLVKKLGEVCVNITDGDHMPPPKSNDGVPFITISNINKESNQIDFTNTFFVPQIYYDAIKDERKARIGDVLYTVTGSYGIPIIVDDDKPFCFQRHIGLLRPNQDIIIPVYLANWIKSEGGKQQADAKATGIAQKTVSLSSLKTFSLPLPPLSLQQSFAAKVSAIEEQKRFISQSIKDVESLLAQRMDHYFG